jgi:hypothetical protein
MAVLAVAASRMLVAQGTRPLAHHHKATTVEMAMSMPCRTTLAAVVLVRQVILGFPTATGVLEAVRFPHGRRRPQRVTAATSLVAGVAVQARPSTKAGLAAVATAAIRVLGHRTELRIRAAVLAVLALDPVLVARMRAALVARES